MRTDTHGFIQANERLETNVPGIYVLGDIKGGPAFTHISYDDFPIIRSESSRAAAPQPEIAWCPTPCSSIRSWRAGMSEQEAREKGRKEEIKKQYVVFCPVLGSVRAGGRGGGGDVTLVAPGDRVVIAWRAPCGECPQCRRGDPRRCSSQLRAKRRMHRADDGALLTPVLRCGTYADQAIVHEACAIKVPEELPVEQAALLACGFSTGAGAALWATPVREGSDVAVIGCGGVGLAVVQGALLRGAARMRRCGTRQARACAEPRRDRRRGRILRRSRRSRP